MKELKTLLSMIRKARKVYVYVLLGGDRASYIDRSMQVSKAELVWHINNIARHSETSQEALEMILDTCRFDKEGDLHINC